MMRLETKTGRRSALVERILCEPWMWCFAWELWEGAGAQPLPSGRDDAVAREAALHMWKGCPVKVGDQVIAVWSDQAGGSMVERRVTVEEHHLELAARICSMLDAFMGAKRAGRETSAPEEARPAFAAGVLPKVIARVRAAMGFFDSLTLMEEEHEVAAGVLRLLSLTMEEAEEALAREEEAGICWPACG